MPANVEWHEKNHTYTFAYGLGAVIVVLGLLLCLHPWPPQLAALGGSGIPDVIGDTLFSHPNAGVLGRLRRRQPRLPVPELGRAAASQGFHHDGCRTGGDGRFGERRAGIPAMSEDSLLAAVPQPPKSATFRGIPLSRIDALG